MKSAVMANHDIHLTKKSAEASHSPPPGSVLKTLDTIILPLLSIVRLWEQ
jgi:hypothetical protein